jgi:hypothetical protein
MKLKTTAGFKKNLAHGVDVALDCFWKILIILKISGNSLKINETSEETSEEILLKF